MSIPNDGAYVSYEEDDFVDDTFEATEGARAIVGDVDSVGYSSGRTFPISCVALYDFQVNVMPFCDLSGTSVLFSTWLVLNRIHFVLGSFC